MIENAMQLTELIENQLGCPPPNPKNVDRWRARVILANRIKRQIGKNPKKFTWANLEAAVAYVRARHIVINSPMAVFYYVDRAIRLAAEPEDERPISNAIDDAIAWEHEHHQPGWGDWITRLVNAFGPARHIAVDEWRKVRQP